MSGCGAHRVHHVHRRAAYHGSTATATTCTVVGVVIVGRGSISGGGDRLLLLQGAGPLRGDHACVGKEVGDDVGKCVWVVSVVEGVWWVINRVRMYE